MGAAKTAGVEIFTGATVSGTGAAQVTIIGQAVTNSTLGNAEVGSAPGVEISTDTGSGSQTAQVTSASGSISITGTGGTSPNGGVGVLVVAPSGTIGTTADITSTSGDHHDQRHRRFGQYWQGTFFTQTSTGAEFPNVGVALVAQTVAPDRRRGRYQHHRLRSGAQRRCLL